MTIRSLVEANGFDAASIKGITLLGSDEEVQWQSTEGGLQLEFGSAAVDLQHAISFAIQMK